MGNSLVLFLGHANAGRTLMADALVSCWGAPTSGLASLLSPGLDDFLLRQRAQDVARQAGWIKLPQATGKSLLPVRP